MGRCLPGLATIAAALLLGACADMNDNPPGDIHVAVSFEGQDALSNGLIESPPEATGDDIVSMAIGAVVITHRDTPYTTAEVRELDEATKQKLIDDTLQSAAYITIIDLPYAGDSVSFLIPPASSSNWQLVAVGSRHDIDVLQDFEKENEDGIADSAIWYGVTEQFMGGIIEPGDTVHMEVVPGCKLDAPPVPPCTPEG
jgi:hypothetical protein